MTRESERYRRFLELIRDFDASTLGPVDEWTEAEAFQHVQTLATEALSPGTIKAARRAEHDRVVALHKRAKQLRKESSANVRHFYRDGGVSQGYKVIVLSTKARAPELVVCRILERVNRHQGLPIGHVFHCNVSSISAWPPRAA